MSHDEKPQDRQNNIADKNRNRQNEIANKAQNQQNNQASKLDQDNRGKNREAAESASVKTEAERNFNQ